MENTTAEAELAKERHRNLDIWRNAVSLSARIYELTRVFPREEMFGLTNQLRRAAVSVASNIAEGSKRPDPDFRRFLDYSLGSLAEIDTQLTIAEMQGFCTYTTELKSELIGLTAGIRRFKASLRAG